MDTIVAADDTLGLSLSPVAEAANSAGVHSSASNLLFVEKFEQLTAKNVAQHSKDLDAQAAKIASLEKRMDDAGHARRQKDPYRQFLPQQDEDDNFML